MRIKKIFKSSANPAFRGQCKICSGEFETTRLDYFLCSDKCRKVWELRWSKEYHQRNRTVRNINARNKRLANKLRAIEYKGGKCFDCQQSFHVAVYDFHHLDPSQKDIPIGSLLNWSWGVQQKELDKCVMLCANCHRLRHHKGFTNV